MDREYQTTRGFVNETDTDEYQSSDAFVNETVDTGLVETGGCYPFLAMAG